MNLGDFRRFPGIERITRAGVLVYPLFYFGGTVRP